MQIADPPPIPPSDTWTCLGSVQSAEPAYCILSRTLKMQNGRPIINTETAFVNWA